MVPQSTAECGTLIQVTSSLDCVPLSFCFRLSKTMISKRNKNFSSICIYGAILVVIFLSPHLRSVVPEWLDRRSTTNLQPMFRTNLFADDVFVLTPALFSSFWNSPKILNGFCKKEKISPILLIHYFFYYFFSHSTLCECVLIKYSTSFFSHHLLWITVMFVYLGFSLS